ncbi:MAG: hypothetical protein JXA13_07590 [Anaerolineales bacterium]|nr:hypothetical protein [Anaerolineales bacterium]
MNKYIPLRLFSIIGVLVATALACNFPSVRPAPPAQVNSITVAPETLPPAAQPAIAIDETPPTAAIVHVSMPEDAKVSGAINYDVESQSTASEKRAPYGESYKLNRFERPFTQNDMTYLPDIDILYFYLISKAEYYYIFIELIGSNPNNPDAEIHYGVEIDLELDGHGNYLIWASQPYSTEWSTDPIKIFSDQNSDTGGPSTGNSDAPSSGNGYETLIFENGLGDDPDLAWVRIDPGNPNIIQFALKASLFDGDSSFLWNVLADAGVKDPGKYNYNDHFTEEEAGSAVKGNEFYPPKQLFAFDNTCRSPYNFNPTYDEPLICPGPEMPAPGPGEPSQPAPTLCPRPASCSGVDKIWHQDTCTCEIIGPW